MFRTLIVVLTVLVLTACQTAAKQESLLTDKKMTVGVVQKEIRKGMSQADVARSLGSPNLVTRDKDGIETWIYDKISTEYAYSETKAGVDSLILGWGGSALGGLAPSMSSSSGATSTSQRTLTVIIKFAEGAVDEFSYNATTF